MILNFLLILGVMGVDLVIGAEHLSLADKKTPHSS